MSVLIECVQQNGFAGGCSRRYRTFAVRLPLVQGLSGEPQTLCCDSNLTCCVATETARVPLNERR